MILRGLIALILLASQAAFAAITLQDDTGRSITLTHFPQRIVSLVPHITELIYAVGASPQLVGADSASDYPDAAKNSPGLANTAG